MTPERESRELRDLAAALLAVEERARSLRRLPISDETEDMLDKVAMRLAVDADALQLAADIMSPPIFVLTLFQWAKGKTVPVVVP